MRSERQRVPERTGLSELELDELARVICTRTGIAPSASRVARRAEDIADIMEMCGIETGAELIAGVSSSPALFQALIDLITVNETYFFRGREQFDLIGRLLTSAHRSRTDAGPIRVWSAGCASGEEAYSLAILLKDTLPGAAASVLGTDISQSAIDKARGGTYTPWSFREVPPESLVPHIAAANRSYRVSEALKSLVEFRTHNLLSQDPVDWAPLHGLFDLIILRNVLIYFTSDAIERAIHSLQQCMAPGAWLVAGPSDPIVYHRMLSMQVGAEGAIYRKQVELEERPDEPRLVAPMKPSAIEMPVRIEPPMRKADLPIQIVEVKQARNAADDGDLRSVLAKHFRERKFEEVVRLSSGALLDQPCAELRAESLANLTGSAALTAVDRLVEQFPLSARLRYLRALIYFAEHRLADAVKACREITFIEPACASAHILLGEIRLRCGDVTSAQHSFRSALLAFGKGDALDRDLITSETREELEDLARERLAAAMATRKTRQA